MSAEQVGEWLKNVVSGMVSNPDDIQIANSSDDMGVLFVLKAHKEDVGKLIGREGSTAKAIRTLLRCVGLSNKIRANLRIDDGRPSNKPQNDYN